MVVATDVSPSVTSKEGDPVGFQLDGAPVSEEIGTASDCGGGTSVVLVGMEVFGEFEGATSDGQKDTFKSGSIPPEPGTDALTPVGRKLAVGEMDFCLSISVGGFEVWL